MKNKYGNTWVEVDGIKFQSKREAKRYGILKMLVMAGEITDLKLQIPYELNPGGSFSYKYKADFVYTERGNTIVEDVKGHRTREYKKKAKLMLKIHGIKIKEI